MVFMVSMHLVASTICVHISCLPASAYQRVLHIVEINRMKRLHRTLQQCSPQRTATTFSARSKAPPEIPSAEKPAGGAEPWTTEIEEHPQNTKKLKKRRVVGEVVQKHKVESSLTGECGNCRQGIRQGHPSAVQKTREDRKKTAEPESEETTRGGGEDSRVSSCNSPKELSSWQSVGLPSRSIMRKRARTEQPEERLHPNKADSQVWTCSIGNAALEAQKGEPEEDGEVSATRLSVGQHLDTNKRSERSGDQAKDYTKPRERECETGGSEHNTGERPRADKQGQETKEDKEKEEAGQQHRAQHIKKGGDLVTAGETAVAVHDPKSSGVPPSCCLNEFSRGTKPCSSCSSSSSQPLFHPSPSLLNETCSDRSAQQSPVTSPCCSPGTYICANEPHPVASHPPLPSPLYLSNLASSPSFPASSACLPSSSSSFPLSTHPSPTAVFPSPLSSSVSPSPSPSFPSSSFSGVLPCQCSSASSSRCHPSLTFHSSSPCLAPHCSTMASSSSSSSSLPFPGSSISPLNTTSLSTICAPSSWQSILRLCRLNASETQIPLERTMRKVAQNTAALASKDIERCLLAKTEKRALVRRTKQNLRGTDISAPSKEHSENEEKEEEAVAPVEPSEYDTRPVKNGDLPTTAPPTEENEERTAQPFLAFRNQPFYNASLERHERISGVRVDSKDLDSNTSTDSRRPTRRGRRRSLDGSSASMNPYRSPEQPEKESFCENQEEEVKTVAQGEKERSFLWRDEFETAVISMLEKTRCRSVRQRNGSALTTSLSLRFFML